MREQRSWRRGAVVFANAGTDLEESFERADQGDGEEAIMKKGISLFYIVFLQPPALVTWAMLIVLFYWALTFLGWREYTTVLSGTFPTGVPAQHAAQNAAVYMAAYFGAVLVAPIMILGAGINLAMAWLMPRRTPERFMLKHSGRIGSSESFWINK